MNALELHENTLAACARHRTGASPEGMVGHAVFGGLAPCLAARLHGLRCAGQGKAPPPGGA